MRFTDVEGYWKETNEPVLPQDESRKIDFPDETVQALDRRCVTTLVTCV